MLPVAFIRPQRRRLGEGVNGELKLIHLLEDFLERDKRFGVLLGLFEQRAIQHRPDPDHGVAQSHLGRGAGDKLKVLRVSRVVGQ